MFGLYASIYGRLINIIDTCNIYRQQELKEGGRGFASLDSVSIIYISYRELSELP